MRSLRLLPFPLLTIFSYQTVLTFKLFVHRIKDTKLDKHVYIASNAYVYQKLLPMIEWFLKYSDD